MNKYYYGDILLAELPNYNKTEYPYAIIYYDDSNNIYLAYSNLAFYVEISTLYGGKGAVIYTCAYNEDNINWGAASKYSEADFVIFMGKVIWSNTNILNQDNQLVLAGIKPELARIFDYNEWLRGFIDVLGSSYFFTKESKEPVAYLYNGVRLPALPERDEETYPYAAIGQQPSNSVFFLRFNDKAITVGANNSTIFWNDGNTYKLVDGVWQSDAASISAAIFWANHNIYYSNEANIGELCVAASTPIPVYE